MLHSDMGFDLELHYIKQKGKPESFSQLQLL